MTLAILKKMYAVLDMSIPVNAVFSIASLFAFMCLFRKSNLVPDSADGFDSRKQLRQQDVVFTEDKVVVGIRWCKNKQFAHELLTFPLAKLPRSVLCPELALKNLYKLVPKNPQSLLFALPNGESLTYRAFQTILRDTLQKCNVPFPNSFSSHSYRRRGTTFSFLCGIPVEVIKLLGNWKSDAYLAYIEFPLETRTAACELMRRRLQMMERFNN